MTTKEREQVVALLRCAADQRTGLGVAAILVGADHRTLNRAHQVYKSIPASMSWFETLLEAAQRVEEGSWP